MLFKKTGFVWKRCRRSIAKKPDKALVQSVIIKIAILLRLAKQGVSDVFFADEVAFSLMPYIPYRYQKKGEQIAIPSSKKKVVNVLGLLNPITKQLITYCFDKDQRMNSENFIKFMNDFAAQIKRPTTVILDNASWHKSKATKAMFEQWKKLGLTILFLPPRSPHLNLIETLWRKVKYEWLFTADYASEKKMLKKLKHIFKNYGDEYDIQFSMNIFNIKINL